MLRLAVLVSGGGTNLQAIIESIESGYLKNVEISEVVSSKESVYAVERAKKSGLNVEVFARKRYINVCEYDRALIDCLQK